MKTSILGLAFVVAGVCHVLPSDWYRAALLVMFGAGVVYFTEDSDKQPKRSADEEHDLDSALTDD